MTVPVPTDAAPGAEVPARRFPALRTIPAPAKRGRGALPQDLAGTTFGRLTVTGLDDDPRRSTTNRHAYWRATCSCGGETVVRADSLRQREVRSCGCLRRESRTRGIGRTRGDE